MKNSDILKKQALLLSDVDHLADMINKTDIKEPKIVCSEKYLRIVQANGA